MGNYCYFPDEVRNYESIKGSEDADSKFFIFGQFKSKKSFIAYFDSKVQSVYPLKIDKKVNLYNLSGSVMLNPHELAICGGINSDLKYITNSFLIYNIKKNTFK